MGSQYSTIFVKMRERDFNRKRAGEGGRSTVFLEKWVLIRVENGAFNRINEDSFQPAHSVAGISFC